MSILFLSSGEHITKIASVLERKWCFVKFDTKIIARRKTGKNRRRLFELEGKIFFTATDT